jgi:hypothetical protein
MAGHDFAKIVLNNDETFDVYVGSGEPVAWATVGTGIQGVSVGGISINPRRCTDTDTIVFEGAEISVEEYTEYNINLETN